MPISTGGTIALKTVEVVEVVVEVEVSNAFLDSIGIIAFIGIVVCSMLMFGRKDKGKKNNKYKQLCVNVPVLRLLSTLK